jgi:hypothetical protein
VATVRDLSASGLSVQSAAPLPLGTDVAVTLVAPDRILQSTAKVARSDPRSGRDGFNTWIVGLRFAAEQPTENVDPFRRWDAA